MEYLLVMALSGSTMTCVYLLVHCIARERLSARAYDLLAKAAVLYYLIPLPFLKDWYREVVPSAMWERRMVTDRIPLTWTNYTVHADGDFYVNIFAGAQAVIAVVWLAGAGFLIMKKVIEYLRATHRFAAYAEMAMTEQQKEFVADLKKEYGVKRKVSLLQARDGDPSFTFGIHRPVIICAKDTNSREAELLVRHEMIHIKRMDVLWKILMEFVTFVHWWNVFAWKLRPRLENVGECVCDETVVQGRSDEEADEYKLLLIEEMEKEEMKKLSAGWKAGFNSNTKLVCERMDNLMRKNKWNRLAAGVLAVTLIMANSMTVFAYRDTLHETITEDVSQQEIDKMLGNDIFMFAPGVSDGEGELALKPAIEILYDNQFMDEDGNIYEMFGDDSISPYCNHVYVSGTALEHHTFSDGSCEVKEYNAERCAKCGWVIRGEWINTYTWAKCPH